MLDLSVDREHGNGGGDEYVVVLGGCRDRRGRGLGLVDLVVEWSRQAGDDQQGY